MLLKCKSNLSHRPKKYEKLIAIMSYTTRYNAIICQCSNLFFLFVSLLTILLHLHKNFFFCCLIIFRIIYVIIISILHFLFFDNKFVLIFSFCYILSPCVHILFIFKVFQLRFIDTSLYQLRRPNLHPIPRM